MTAIYQSRELAAAAVDKLKVYVQPQRLMILSCLLSGERMVSDIDSATSIGQPALSQQLAELRRAGLVTTRKEARSVLYSIADDKTALCVRTMEAIFADRGDIVIALDNGKTPNPVRHSPAGAASFARVG